MTANNKYQQQTTQPAPPPLPNYTDRIGLHTWVAAVGLPLVQAIITGIFAALVVAYLIYLADGSSYFAWMVGVFLLVSFVTWASLQRRWLQLTNIEKMLGVDLNNDKVIGEPEPLKVVISQIDENKTYSQDRYDWTKVITKEQLIKFAIGVIRRKRPISRPEWTPKSKGFSDGSWRKWQDIMEQAGLIVKEGSGFMLTKRGRKFFTAIADAEEASPIPHQDQENPEQ